MIEFLPLLLSLQMLRVLLPPETPEPFETDEIGTSAGPLKITFIGHASLMFSFRGKIIHVDPHSHQADFSHFPKADLILITHEHKDHCDPEAVAAVCKETSRILTNSACTLDPRSRIVMRNGDERIVDDIPITAVPAYNRVHMREDDSPYHPRGVGNGYVITFGDKRVYIAGDTENIPEMRNLGNIDIAFLPMNLPFTMTPAMAADAAKSFSPKILYPYHFADTDTSILIDLLQKTGMEVRIRKMRYGGNSVL